MIRYADRDWIDLGLLAARQYSEVDDKLGTWARGFIAANPTDTPSLLKDISPGIASTISYQSREEGGYAGTVEDARTRMGSCRDFAVLFAEAVRSLGFGSRLVSGHPFNPNRSLVGSTDSGSTHAWAEVFIPGAGWITFDPTNCSMGASVPNVSLVLPISLNDRKINASIHFRLRGTRETEGLSIFRMLEQSSFLPHPLHALNSICQSGHYG